MDYLRRFNVDQGQRIKKALKKAQVETKQFCIDCRIAPSSLKNYILGYQSPSLEKFLLLANKLNVSADALIGNKQYMWHTEGFPEAEDMYLVCYRQNKDGKLFKKYAAAQWDHGAFFDMHDGMIMDFTSIIGWKPFEECEDAG